MRSAGPRASPIRCTLLTGWAVLALACADGTSGARPGDRDRGPVDGAVRDAAPRPDADADATDAGEADGAPVTDARVAEAALPPLPPPVTVTGERFATSGVCALCHASAPDSAAMRDETGASVAAFDSWQGSMMANAARDPLWRAAMSAEIAGTPAARAAIEAKCTRCHGPAGWHESAAPDATLITGGDTAAQLARDGVTCTACHGIEPDGLGTEASFTGAYVFGPDRVAYGPHEQPNDAPMERFSGFSGRLGAHVLDPGLCGTCHTLITDSVAEDGTPTGHALVEQATFLEWRNSRFPAAGLTCQACHLPTTSTEGTPLRTVIARGADGQDLPFVSARSPVGRHLLVGGNAWMPRVLDTFRDVLRPQATSQALRATEAAARAQLARAARLEITGMRREEEGLVFAVTVHNQSGHKLPTGFPSRRAWLRVTVRGPEGDAVFESGAHDATGRLIAGGAVLPGERADGPIEPHHQIIERPDQVQIYASEMCDPTGRPTGLLLRASHYCQDDRLLPQGWHPAHADAARAAPVGVDDDPDFAAGQDVVTYRVPAPRVAGGYTVEVSLLYQVLSPRFADALWAADTPEVRQMRRFVDAVPALPEVVAEARASGE